MVITRLINDDCRTFLFSTQPKSIDLTVTSPPYDNLRTYNNSSNWDWSVFMSVASGLFRVTKPGGVIVWVVGDATVNGSETGTSFKQALFFKEIGFKLHDTMIWEKPGFTDVGSLQCRYAQVFEYMFIFSKGKLKTFNPLKDRKNKHAGKQILKGVTLRKPDGAKRTCSNPDHVTPKYSQRFNVWRINSENSKNNQHPAPFIEQLAKDHIISWSNEGDVVLDPFMGSGTTGKVAKELNRNFIGIEIDKSYFEMAKQRIDL